MDKFLNIKRKLNDYDENNGDNKRKKTTVTETSRKYHDNYLNFGFTFCGSETIPIPQCLVCGEKLSNECMVPSKLKRHFTSKHGHLLNKDKTYFSRLLSSNVKQSKQLEKLTNISDKAQIASYKVAELIVKKMQPHTIAENLILPACKEIVKSMLGESAEKEVSRVPLSNNTISRRIDDMSSDIKKHVSEILCDGRKFSLQIDESTDISQKCQLLSYIRFIENNEAIEQFLSCTELLTTSTGQDIYNCVSDTLKKNELLWTNCISVCTDGAPAMTGKFKGFVSRLKQDFPNIISTHCFIHREALMIKSIPDELKNVLDLVIKMVNYIKSRSLKTRILKKMCEEAGSRYEVLVLHTEIRWLSKGKVLNRFYEMKNELLQLFNNEDPNRDFVTQLNNPLWSAKLAYLADIFNHLNILNSNMQGKDENILTSSDKLNGFLRKINLWISHVEKKQLQMFPLTADVDPDGEVTSELIINHIIILKEKNDKIFPIFDY